MMAKLTPTKTAHCCIIGAGPAGLILGLLLARKGIRVKVVEMHADLDRDFRGDTVHASSLELLDQIDLADGALKLPHAKIETLSIVTPSKRINLVSFSRLKTRFRYVAMMPQEHFLKYIQECAERYENFELLFNTAVTGLCRDKNNKVNGVQVKHTGSTKEIQSDLVIACDGRFSKTRRMANFKAIDQSPPIDVAWFRIDRITSDQENYAGFYVAAGKVCICLSRTTNWQIGYIFPKGDFQTIKHLGTAALQTSLKKTIPWLGERVSQIGDFDNIHVLKIKADRLDKWYTDGLLFIGDAAHAMSPAGGVGINFAISDAVEAANVLIKPLKEQNLTTAHLAEIQRRRLRTTKIMQVMQRLMLSNAARTIGGKKDFDLPLIAKLILATPWLRDIPAKLAAFGISRTRLEDP